MSHSRGVSALIVSIEMRISCSVALSAVQQHLEFCESDINNESKNLNVSSKDHSEWIIINLCGIRWCNEWMIQTQLTDLCLCASVNEWDRVKKTSTTKSFKPKCCNRRILKYFFFCFKFITDIMLVDGPFPGSLSFKCCQSIPRCKHKLSTHAIEPRVLIVPNSVLARALFKH